MNIAPELLCRIVEGALLAAAQPMSEERLLALFEEDEQPERFQLREALEQIGQRCEGRGFELCQVASGWRLQVPEVLAPWVNKLWEEKPQRYSRATLETLAIIAYRQPITRGDIEDIRGVAVSSQIVRSLADRGWIKVVGQRDVPGKPSLYATTREFLDYFNLKSLDDLPTLAEIRDIDSLNAVLDLGLDPTAVDDEDLEGDAGDEVALTGAAKGGNALAAGSEHAESEKEYMKTAPADAVPTETEITEIAEKVDSAAESYAEENETPQALKTGAAQRVGGDTDLEAGASAPAIPDHPESEALTEPELLDEDDNKSRNISIHE